MRVMNMIEASGLDKDYTYRQILDLVSSAKKVRDANDGEWIMPTITMKAQEALKALGLLESCKNEEENAIDTPKRKGRPKGSKNKKQ